MQLIANQCISAYICVYIYIYIYSQKCAISAFAATAWPSLEKRMLQEWWELVNHQVKAHFLWLGSKSDDCHLINHHLVILSNDHIICRMIIVLSDDDHDIIKWWLLYYQIIIIISSPALSVTWPQARWLPLGRPRSLPGGCTTICWMWKCECLKVCWHPKNVF